MMKILCLFGRHNLQEAINHPDRGMGYHIVECSRCPKALVRDSQLGKWYPIANTQATIAKNKSKAHQRDGSKSV
ncbi:hypothetical protein [Pseudomonas sp. NPDC096950]|uniref:hypothetical protein n=1 Tax=Pseudomonas sp. NPDC096950 TaxID=3364485 RepID=UPI00383B1821